MLWHNNPEDERAMQLEQRQGFSGERARLMRLARTDLHLATARH